MRFDKDFIYWSMPAILWLLQQLHHSGALHTLGRGMNHNETLVLDKE